LLPRQFYGATLPCFGLYPLEKTGIAIYAGHPLNSGWMHFEAGAISKSKDDAQVCPILFGLRPTDLTGPLQQFQVTVFSEEDMFKLMKAINARLGDQALTEARLERQFLHWWPELDKQINSILEQQMAPSEKPARSSRELLEEILTIVRESQKNNQQVKNDNNKFQFSEQTSRVFQKLSRACLQTSYRSQISEAARHTKAAKTSASLS